MRKEDPHEAYCGCRDCKPLDTTDIPEEEDWPLFRPEDKEAGAAETAPSPEH